MLLTRTAIRQAGVHSAEVAAEAVLALSASVCLHHVSIALAPGEGGSMWVPGSAVLRVGCAEVFGGGVRAAAACPARLQA